MRAARDRPPDHRLVAKVEAVEIAKREHAPRKGSGIGWSRVRRCMAAALTGEGKGGNRPLNRYPGFTRGLPSSSAVKAGRPRVEARGDG